MKKKLIILVIVVVAAGVIGWVTGRYLLTLF